MCYMKRIVLLGLLACMGLSGFAQSPRWSEAQSKDWFKKQGWLCGMNYIPSNAINYTAMWDKTSFSPDLIDRELKAAEELGLNCARVVLQYAVYADDPKYFLKTLDKFLAICDKHGIKVMPVFFDDCVFGANTDPVIGKQPEPLEGWYAWAWSPSPGHTMVIDERTHGHLEKYVKEVMGRFKNDNRILLWDLYNEPTNGGLGDRSMPLVRKVFAWAKEVDPVQPLSIGVWCGNEGLNKFCTDNSDIITFHCYSTAENTNNEIQRLKAYGRPIICTEWMNRPAGSTIETVLPLFKKENVRCMMWGLVNGKTQTNLPWGHRPEHLPYNGPWQHDILTSDFQPYDKAETELLQKLCK